MKVLGKLLTVLLVASVLITATVQASTPEGLERAFNDLHYSLTVEWDQQDKEFYKAQVRQFGDQIRELKEEGLTNQDLMEFAIAQLKNDRVAKEARETINQVDMNKLTSEEAMIQLKKLAEKSSSKGASWEGHEAAPAVVFIGLVVCAMVVFYWAFHQDNGEGTVIIVE